MVLYNKQAELDLHNILIGLATWKKHPLGFEHAREYVKDIRKASDDICTSSFHKQCVFQIHKKHGDKVFVVRDSQRYNF